MRLRQQVHGRTRMNRTVWITSIMLLSLCACASQQANKSAKPDPHLVAKLGRSIQAHIHYPDNSRNKIPEGANATVQLNYGNGQLKNILITKSTGNSFLDSTLLRQLRSIRLPENKFKSLKRSQRFEFTFDIVNPRYTRFMRSLYQAISQNMTYPNTPETGMATVIFTYVNGTLSKVKIFKTSGNKSLDRAALDAVLRTRHMPTPAWVHNDKFRYTIAFCFGSRQCGEKQEKLVSVPEKICSEVGFQYLNKKIANTHLLKSSGNTPFDKAAVASVVTGNFTPPKSRSGKPQTNYKIAVCYKGK